MTGPVRKRATPPGSPRNATLRGHVFRPVFTYMNDFRHAARTLVRARAFTAICVTSLGLGMGVVILIFLLMRLVFSPPPGVKADGLVELVIRPSGQLLAQAGAAIIDTWSYPDYLDVRSTPGLAVTGWSRGEGLYQPPDQRTPESWLSLFVWRNYL